MIEIKDKIMCCGCTACYNVCPVNAISMKSDEEGFLYPNVDINKCVNCGLCEKVCPILHKEYHEEKTEGYIIRYKNEKIVEESTSGGAFTAFSEYLMSIGYVVYGAGFDSNMKVVCKMATNSKQLEEMRGSKFVQSYLGSTFKRIKEQLSKGEKVLFTGTPCQIAGLVSYLGGKPDGLICIDFVCRGVPSPGLWKNYVNMMENKFNSKMIGAKFKHKTYGYHASTMKVDFANGQTWYGSGRVDPMMKAFVRELASRPSCHSCSFKSINRLSDITMFDCYEYSKLTGKADDDQGWSSLLIHSENGERIFERIKSSLQWTEEDVELLVENNGVMVNNSAKPHIRRDEFYHLISNLSIEEAMDKIEPITTKDMIIEKSKVILYRTGLIKNIRKVCKKNQVEIVE